MHRDLMPTLWRTCRVLANTKRLEIVAFLRQHGAADVATVARACGLSRTGATVYLRALQARGLLRATRRSRWVIYHAEADPLVPHAPGLLIAVLAALQHQQAHQAMCKQATAFTHERRIRIVQALAVEPQSALSLCRRCRISLQALGRHLQKLARRGFVRQDIEAAVWHLLRPPDAFGRALMHLALSDGHFHTLQRVEVTPGQKRRVAVAPGTTNKGPRKSV